MAQQNLQEARQAALAKKQEFDRQAALDKSNGYQGVSVEGFALDGKELAAKRAKLAINGYYIRVGDETTSLCQQASRRDGDPAKRTDSLTSCC